MRGSRTKFLQIGSKRLCGLMIVSAHAEGRKAFIAIASFVVLSTTGLFDHGPIAGDKFVETSRDGRSV